MDAAGPTATTRARIKLSHLGVHALALVGEGANLRRFAEVRKANSMDTGTNKALVLPTAAKEQLESGLTKGIEAFAAILDMVKTAQTTDDGTAQVPTEFADQGMAAVMLLAALFQQFGATMPDAEPASAGQEDMSGLSAEEMALAKSMPGAVVKAALLAQKSIESVSKGKVKMSFENAMKLHGGLLEKLYAIASELAPLVSEFGAEGVAAALGTSDKTNKSANGASGGQTDGDTAAVAAVQKSLAALQADVQRIAKARNPSNQVQRDNGGNETSVHMPRYGANLSEVVKQRQAQAAQTKTA